MSVALLLGAALVLFVLAAAPSALFISRSEHDRFWRSVSNIWMQGKAAAIESRQSEELVGTNRYLVDGIVVDVRPPDPGGVAALTIRVCGVYCGPEDLAGRTFTDEAADKVISLNSLVQPIRIPPKGAEGIWVVAPEGSSLVPLRLYHLVDRRWPSLPRFDQRYEQAKLLAQAIKSVAAQVSKEEKVTSFAQAAFSQVPEISIWATRALFDANRESLLLEGSGPCAGLSVVGKVVADEMLVERRGENWALSQDRFQMLLAVADARKESFEAHVFVEHLEAIAQREADHLPSDVLVSVLEREVGNKDDPLDVRKVALGVAYYPLQRGGDARAADLLIDEMESGCPELAQVAVRILGHDTLLNDRQRTRLTELRLKASDPKRVKDIDGILAGGSTR